MILFFIIPFVLLLWVVFTPSIYNATYGCRLAIDTDDWFLIPTIRIGRYEDNENEYFMSFECLCFAIEFAVLLADKETK